MLMTAIADQSPSDKFMWKKLRLINTNAKWRNQDRGIENMVKPFSMYLITKKSLH